MAKAESTYDNSTGHVVPSQFGYAVYGNPSDVVHSSQSPPMAISGTYSHGGYLHPHGSMGMMYSSHGVDGMSIPPSTPFGSRGNLVPYQNHDFRGAHGGRGSGGRGRGHFHHHNPRMSSGGGGRISTGRGHEEKEYLDHLHERLQTLERTVRATAVVSSPSANATVNPSMVLSTPVVTTSLAPIAPISVTTPPTTTMMPIMAGGVPTPTQLVAPTPSAIPVAPSSMSPATSIVNGSIPSDSKINVGGEGHIVKSSKSYPKKPAASFYWPSTHFKFKNASKKAVRNTKGRTMFINRLETRVQKWVEAIEAEDLTFLMQQVEIMKCEYFGREGRCTYLVQVDEVVHNLNLPLRNPKLCTHLAIRHALDKKAVSKEQVLFTYCGSKDHTFYEHRANVENMRQAEDACAKALDSNNRGDEEGDSKVDNDETTTRPHLDTNNGEDNGEDDNGEDDNDEGDLEGDEEDNSSDDFALEVKITPKDKDVSTVVPPSTTEPPPPADLKVSSTHSTIDVAPSPPLRYSNVNV